MWKPQKIKNSTKFWNFQEMREEWDVSSLLVAVGV